jgi:signal transduction histidine kinase
MLAHEIRNPLAAIRNSVAVLKHAGRDAAAAAAAQGAIDRQMVHLVRLMEDLLDVARISRGRLALQRVRMDLRQALEQAIEVSLPMCRRPNRCWTSRSRYAAPCRRRRRADHAGDRQPLNNACKFTQREADPPTVGVENGHAIVGSRITASASRRASSRLFDMFSQIDTSSSAPGGLGMGLNLVKQLVEMRRARP